jgi:tetratricopeptide (TPR) repeat protein
VALVCLVWGEEFADFFARYCIPSLLEPQNIPLVSREQDVTLLLYTDRNTQEFLDRCDSFKSLSAFAKVELLPLEQLPAATRANHWVPWQHAVAGRNRDFDRFLVVIPDCVYAAGCLGTIMDALEEHDTVYYTLPQVCRETVAAELDGLRRVDGHEYISFTSLQAVELFIRHVNPKHAAAACSSTFFVNHPEIVIELSPKSIVVSETGSHPFAVRSGTRNVSYTLGALSPEAKTCYLEILGVSAEPALKFVEEYYRWPRLFRNHSRLMSLGRWACLFRDANNVAYSKSAIHITLDHGCVLEQHRGQVKRAKTRFTNATLDWLAVAIRIYDRAREFPDAAGAKYIALAMAAPGFHRQLRRLQSGFTVVLPKSESGFGEVVKRIERHAAAKELLRRFLFLHVVPGQLPIVPGHAIFLTYSDAADDFPKAFVVDHHTVALGAGMWGKAISPLQWVWEEVFSVKADIDYSHLTWSMLDPLHGTSERVLDHPVSTDAMAGAAAPLGVPHADRGSAGSDNDRALLRRVTEGASRVAFTACRIASFGVVTAYNVAIKLPLVGRWALLARNLYRKGRGKPWLSMGDAGIDRPVLRRAGHAARESPAEPALSVPRRPSSPLTESARASYDAISRLNIVDNVAKVTLAFHERLGLSPQQSPAYRCLASLRSKLAEEVEAQGAISPQSSLERFELAWRAYEAGNTHEALQLFGEVIADRELAGAGAADPRAREAFVRAAEILGRHAEIAGDISSAAQLYRRILELDGDGNGNVARRLLLMLWREARIQEAAELAPRVLLSDGNIAQHLRGSDAVKDLARRLGCEIRREATPATDAREVGLPDRCAARAPDDLAQAFAEMQLSTGPAPLRS